MSTSHFIVATAGHVDHGKSALVKALTGTDPDRLPEEKARGITIDLGFAHLELPAPNAPGASYQIGIVDVPGHEDFVKNMVAGVGSIDVALFIVAADDGWMPQTEEHLQILSYLGVRRAVVALTKIDLLGSDSDRTEALAQIRERLVGSPFADAPIIGTSVVNGAGIDELRAALAVVLAGTPPPADFGKPRLPVDRVFVLRGIGTVVTGTLNGGLFRRGQNVVIQPAARSTKIRTVQSHNREVEASVPGTRTALNLPDIPRRSDQEPSGIQRGDIVTLPELGGPSDTLDVWIEKSARLQEKDAAARPLKSGSRVRVHHGSSHFTARVWLVGTDAIAPGQGAVAQMRADEPVYAFSGDSFIVRDWSEQQTLAGGRILDADGRRKHFRTDPYRRFLEARARAGHDVAPFVASQLERDGAVRCSALLLKSRFSATSVSQATSQLAAKQQAVLLGDWVADAAWWTKLRQRAIDAIDAEHRARPQHVGLALSELRTALESALAAPDLFDALVSELCRTGFVQSGTAIRRATHRQALPPALQAAGTKLRSTLAAKPLDPPSRKELAPTPDAVKALRFLIETGEAVEVGDEIVLSTESYARATETVKQHLRQHGSATVSELRQAIGASRRIVVPLLERLDKEGLTRREGDKRVLRKPI